MESYPYLTALIKNHTMIEFPSFIGSILSANFLVQKKKYFARILQVVSEKETILQDSGRIQLERGDYEKQRMTNSND